MTTHLSSRLVWHDRAWDGRICDNPGENSYCLVQQHIREAMLDPEKMEREKEAAGVSLADLSDWQPPCSRDPIAFSPIGYTITHKDPLEFRKLPPVGEEIPPYSVCATPYRWMREDKFREICEAEQLSIRGPDELNKEHGWVQEPDRQLALLKNFWERIEKKKSLIFFYCNHGNPLEEDLNRILIGVGLIYNIGSQLFFGRKPPKYDADYPVWSRCVTHDFENNGIRIPYHEYLRNGYDPTNIICRLPESASLEFSYVAEHVSDDAAVGVLERLLQSVDNVEKEGKVPGNWHNQRVWLNDVISEVWKNRGAFPGIGSMLQCLDMELGTSFHRKVLMPLSEKGDNIWEYLLSILEGRKTYDTPLYSNGIRRAVENWHLYPESKRRLLSLIVRFELSPDQAKRIINSEERKKAGIKATDEELVENPYIISEMDEGGKNNDPVSLEVIDRGMRPESDAAIFVDPSEIVSKNDPKRIRGCAFDILKTAASDGHTLLLFSTVLDGIKNLFPERRACIPDRELIIGRQDFYNENIDFCIDIDPPTMAIRQLSELEQEVSKRIKRRIQRKNKPVPEGWSWLEMLKQEFRGESSTILPPEVEKRARKEKAEALDVLLGSRFSVLTGRAGTGKTSVLKVFLKGVEKIEGHRPILLLAPTGKARVRLMERTRRDDGTVRDAYTIHQFLMRNGWLNPRNFALRYEGGNVGGATTVVIDEASMIPMDLLGILFRALDLNRVSRLILVGDPNQLPPIGPGRPFVDIVSWLKSDDDTVQNLYPDSSQLSDEVRNNCIAHLTERARHEDHNSLALQLADCYLSEDSTPGADDLLSRIALRKLGGDLEVHFWKDHTELNRLLSERMEQLLELGNSGYEAFNESLGISKDDLKPKKAENWQILSPVRNHEFGTGEINRGIQACYRGGILKSSRTRKNIARPFGEQEIIWTDKVIQIVNSGRDAWPRGEGLDYVANGEIGLVTRTNKGYLDVTYSTQPDVSYRYFRNQVDNNLELAYALTVHKAQGSDFNYVFLVLPSEALTLSKELLYTGLTRFRHKMILLIENDTKVLEKYRSPRESATLLRNTNLFVRAVQPEKEEKYFASHLIHRTAQNVLVRSKSEVIVADTLTRLGISYEYEKKLFNKDGNPNDFRIPDFTVSFEGDFFYWEHLGMLSVPSYMEQWGRKEKWYEENGYLDQVITSQDSPDGGIDSTTIEKIARDKILLE